MVTKRNIHGYSLLELMSTIVILAIVTSLLYTYQNDGWRLFYNSYGRGLSQIKTKLALRTITDELREANKSRIAIGRGVNYGVPFPDDANYSSPFIYFTKPKVHAPTGEVIKYDYILFYFADKKGGRNNRYLKYDTPLVLKHVKFIDQSKFYTEDPSMDWPFIPPLLENYTSELPEDKAYIQSLEGGANAGEETNLSTSEAISEMLFIDHFARLKKDRRHVPISGGFLSSTLVEPFSKEQASFSFGNSYKQDDPIMIKVEIKEPGLFFGMKNSMTELTTSITPRN